MAGNKSIALFLLLLAFLFLLTAPLVLIFGHYSELVRLPRISPHSITVAATAGLFVIPILFVYAAAIIVALKKRPAAVSKAVVVGKQVHYPWEGAFGPEGETVAEKPRRQMDNKPFDVNYRALAAVAVVLAITGLIVVFIMSNNTLFGRLNNETKAVNADNASAGAAVKNATRILPQAKASVAQLTAAAKSFGSKLKARISGVNRAVWRNMAVAGFVILLAASVFYSRRTGQLAEVPGWFGGWGSWLFGAFAYAGKNKLKVLLWVVAAAVACAIIAAVVFWKSLKMKLPVLSHLSASAVNALVAFRDFVAVYRLYIFIGVLACLAVIGILFVLEKKGKEKK